MPTGRRKDAVARVWVKPGTGKITVNGRDQETYFARSHAASRHQSAPSTITDRTGQYDVICTVKGGGLSGQAGAVKHGISQALTKYEPALRSRRQGSKASSPAIRAWSSARSMAVPRRARASSSRSAKLYQAFSETKERGCPSGRPLFFMPAFLRCKIFLTHTDYLVEEMWMARGRNGIMSGQNARWTRVQSDSLAR